VKCRHPGSFGLLQQGQVTAVVHLLLGEAVTLAGYADRGENGAYVLGCAGQRGGVGHLADEHLICLGQHRGLRGTTDEHPHPAAADAA